MRFSSRFSSQMASPISAAQKAAQEYNGSLPLLDFSQGVPRYSPPPQIIDRLEIAVTEPEMSRYSLRPGIIQLRQEICNNISATYSGNIGPESVIVTAGCNQGFCFAVSSLCDPKDEVILLDPFYFNHDMWLRLEGITPVYFDTAPSYEPDIVELEKVFTPKTRALVISSPSNPTGVAMDTALFSKIFDLCKERSVVLIVDETYRMFRSTDEPPHNLYNEPDVLDHCIFLLSFSKEYGIPGYRVGALVSNTECTRQIMKMFDCITICAPRIGQEAALVGLRECSGWLKKAAQSLAFREDLFKEVMGNISSDFKLVASGSYFGWVQVLNTEFSEYDLVTRLVERCGILVLPGSIFSRREEQFLRFSIASVDELQIRDLPERLGYF